MKRRYSFLFIFILSIPSYAYVGCGPELIKGIQTKKNGEIFLTSETGKRRLLAKTNSPTAKFMFDTAIKAIDNGLFIQVSYPDGYNCNNPNLKAEAEFIYIQNANRN